MAANNVSCTKRYNIKSLILLLLCSSVVLSVNIVSALATPAEGVYSCGSLRSMARVYMSCGAHEKAQPLLERALNLAKTKDASDTELCACMIDLAYLYKNQDRLIEAQVLCRSGLELQEQIYHEDHLYVAYTLRILNRV